MSRQMCLRCADPLSEGFGERFLPIWLLSVYYRAANPVRHFDWIIPLAVAGLWISLPEL